MYDRHDRMKNQADDEGEQRDSEEQTTPTDGGRRFPWDDDPSDGDLGRPVHIDSEENTDRELGKPEDELDRQRRRQPGDKGTRQAGGPRGDHEREKARGAGPR